MKPQEKERILNAAYANGIKVLPPEASLKPTPGLWDIKETKEMLVALAVVLSAIINKNYNVLKIGTALFTGIMGADDIPAEFIDMDENELIECYEAFRANLIVGTPDNPTTPHLELFIEKSFFNMLKQSLDTRDYIMAQRDFELKEGKGE